MEDKPAPLLNDMDIDHPNDSNIRYSFSNKAAPAPIMEDNIYPDESNNINPSKLKYDKIFLGMDSIKLRKFGISKDYSDGSIILKMDKDTTLDYINYLREKELDFNRYFAKFTEEGHLITYDEILIYKNFISEQKENPMEKPIPINKYPEKEEEENYASLIEEEVDNTIKETNKEETIKEYKNNLYSTNIPINDNNFEYTEKIGDYYYHLERRPKIIIYLLSLYFFLSIASHVLFIYIPCEFTLLSMCYMADDALLFFSVFFYLLAMFLYLCGLVSYQCSGTTIATSMAFCFFMLLFRAFTILMFILCLDRDWKNFGFIVATFVMKMISIGGLGFIYYHLADNFPWH